jgi:hypothetical protein
MILCGMSELVITPSCGKSIPGYFAPRTATEIKDDLFVKAAYFNDDTQKVLIITVDICMLDESIVRDIRNSIYRLIQIPPSMIMVSATHTHTGGPIEFWANIVETDAAYVEFLVSRCAEAAMLAFTRRRMARIYSTVGYEADISFNRRYLMRDGSVKTNPGIGNPDAIKSAGIIDPQIPILRVDDEEGNTIGILSNFACHLDTLGGNSYSADYPGVISRFLKTSFGSDTVSIFMMGAAGNINHVDVFKTTFADDEIYPQDRHKRMGIILGAEIVKQCVKARSMSRNPILKISSYHILLQVRQPTQADIDWAYSIKAHLNQDLIGLDHFDSDQIDLFYAGAIIKMANAPSQEGNLYAELQTIQIGEFLIVGIPGELFVELGIEIKSLFPNNNVCINTLANGSIGYILTEEALKNKGYEARLCSTSRLTSAAGSCIISALLNSSSLSSR